MHMSPAQTIRVGENEHQLDWLTASVPGQRVLAGAYRDGLRLSCLCTQGGIDMYVARRGATYYLARMPGTGLLHAETCPSSEASNLYSGADHYSPGAMQENTEGILQVSYGNGTVSLNGLLDAMIEVSGLNEIHANYPAYPAPVWRAVREQLYRSAQNIQIPSGMLDTFFMAPTAFAKETYLKDRDSQEQFLSVKTALRLVCAPLRNIRETKYGWQIALKHMPDTKFWLGSPVGEQLIRHADGTLDFKTPPEHALVLLKVRPASRPGAFQVSDLALRRTDRHYLPCLSDQEALVSEELVVAGRSIFRPLRFDAPWTRTLADYALMDHPNEPIPILVLAPSGSDALDFAKRSLAAAVRHSSNFSCSVWENGRWIVPLPPKPFNQPGT